MTISLALYKCNDITPKKRFKKRKEKKIISLNPSAKTSKQENRKIACILFSVKDFCDILRACGYLSHYHVLRHFGDSHSEPIAEEQGFTPISLLIHEVWLKSGEPDLLCTSRERLEHLSLLFNDQFSYTRKNEDFCYWRGNFKTHKAMGTTCLYPYLLDCHSNTPIVQRNGFKTYKKDTFD